MTIRPLKQEDALFLHAMFAGNAEYYEIFYDSVNTLNEWNCRIDRFMRQTVVNHFILEENGNAVGWLSFADTETAERELCILVIAPKYLRHGYGRQGLLWLIEKSKKDNMHSLLLNVNQNNTRAIRFYQEFGFETVGEEIIPQCNDAVNIAQYRMRMSL